MSSDNLCNVAETTFPVFFFSFFCAGLNYKSAKFKWILKYKGEKMCHLAWNGLYIYCASKRTCSFRGIGSLFKVRRIFIGFWILGTFPYINFGVYDRRRIMTIISCWVVVVLLFVLFMLKFYEFPKVTWSWTEYINCIPLTEHMCDNQGIQLKKWLNI